MVIPIHEVFVYIFIFIHTLMSENPPFVQEDRC